MAGLAPTSAQVRAGRRGAVAAGEDGAVAAGPRGAAASTEDGYAAAGHRGAVVSGEEGYAAVGRNGNVVTGEEVDVQRGAVGRGGAVVVGEEGAAAVGRSGGVVAGPGLVRLAAHDIPADVLVQIFARPEGQRLHVLVRVPLAAMRDVTFPTRDGVVFLDVSDTAQLDAALREAARLWIVPALTIDEDGRQTRGAGDHGAARLAAV